MISENGNGLRAHAGEAFSWPLRIYWEDTDAGGVVYHGAYVHFFERARTEYLRSLGVEQCALLREYGLVFAIARLELRFDAPARLDDRLQASCELVARGGVSLKFTQVLHRVDDNVRIGRASVRAACLDAATFKPCAIPAGLFANLDGVSG